MKRILIPILCVLLLTGCYADERYDDGYDSGYENGFSDGEGSGYHEGYDIGYSEGYDDCRDDLYSEVYYDGYNEGYYGGYSEGYENGCDDGSTDYSYNDGRADAYLAVVKYYEDINGVDYSLIPMVPVTSSFINYVGYSPSSKTLLITMNDMDLYAYFDVKSNVFSGIILLILLEHILILT